MRTPTSDPARVIPVTVARIVQEIRPDMVTQREDRTAEWAEREEKRLTAIPVNKEALTTELNRLSRGPFRDLLADFLSCAPSADDIKRAAMKSPDRWAQALAIVAKLSGYHERLEVEGTARISTMSDAEIEAKLQELITQRAKTLTVKGEIRGEEETDEHATGSGSVPH